MTLFGACVETPAEPEATVKARATEFLVLLQEERWGDVASFVSLDSITRDRMGISEGSDIAGAREGIARWFQELYRNVPPGDVHSVRFHPEDSNLAEITYRAGDFDLFSMRLVEGQWLYTLDGRPGG